MTKAREERQQRGLSITALSYEVKINPTIIGMTERRQLAPNKKVKEVLSNFYKIPEDQLFGDDGLAKWGKKKSRPRRGTAEKEGVVFFDTGLL